MAATDLSLLHPDTLTRTLLLSVRLAPVMVMTPVLSGVNIPASVRVLLVVGLSALMVLGLPPAAPMDAISTMLAAMSELLLGAALAFGVLCAFAAFSFGGRLLDLQAGFGVAQLFDPATRLQMPVLSTAFTQLALVMFFLMDGHHVMMRGLSLLVTEIPPGGALEASAVAPVVVQQAALLFTLGFALVAPVVFWLLLVELGLAVLSRALPQMNILLLGMPVRIVAALLALAVWLKFSGALVFKTFTSLLAGWQAWLQ